MTICLLSFGLYPVQNLVFERGVLLLRGTLQARSRGPSSFKSFPARPLVAVSGARSRPPIKCGPGSDHRRKKNPVGVLPSCRRHHDLSLYKWECGTHQSCFITSLAGFVILWEKRCMPRNPSLVVPSRKRRVFFLKEEP